MVTSVGSTGASSASGASCLSGCWWMGKCAPGPHCDLALCFDFVCMVSLHGCLHCLVHDPESWATACAQACTLWGRAISQSTQHDLPHYRPAPPPHCRSLSGRRAGSACHLSHPAAAPRQRNHGLHAGLPPGGCWYLSVAAVGWGCVGCLVAACRHEAWRAAMRV